MHRSIADISDAVAPVTVVDAIAVLRAGGYDLDFGPVGECPRCTQGGSASAPALVFDRLFRFEGDSNPDDEAMVLGVRCIVCGGSGVFVSAYGPGAVDAASIAGLLDRRGSGYRP